ncbi:hypothetical protein AEAC466_03190 [Asticcacaulis sp. AC466]|uniref:hypothetical protein n=1 Tax=Asticcacaulis sp. AC466 TaxID=1282362 RepID=UPI0003C3D322|nr:hypothetical protein [Asticcacaulis sp. AC466]ESQ86214.1 hypothetical protein AEAC466_03190 [Asticcacaulis sp. AC466]
MNQRETSFARFTRSYQPWGQVRRKNLIARVVTGLAMVLAGVAVMAALALLVVFAASVAVVGALVVGGMALMAFLTRKPAKVHLRTDDGKGVYEARKHGSTWTVY